MPNLSVIVPVYNGQNTLEDCLVGLRQSDFRDYELIVVDDGSRDRTPAIAAKYADKVLSLGGNFGLSFSRKQGAAAASAEVIVYIDADIIVFPDTLKKIYGYFLANPQNHALTGKLSREHPNKDFASQYKNIYMHHVFSGLSGNVLFLYGSIFALRRECLPLLCFGKNFEGEDLSLGQQLISQGMKIGFSKDIEVIHLKKYNLVSLFSNDFRIPFSWAGIFLRSRGWEQWFKSRAGFAHASKKQIIAIMLAWLFLLILPLVLWRVFPAAVIFILLGCWGLFNARFFVYYFREKGIIFGSAASVLTFFDQVVMGAGIVSGFVHTVISYFSGLGRRKN